MMRIITYVAITLFVITLGAAAALYVSAYKPMTAELERMKSALSDFDKTRGELTKYKEKEAKEAQEVAWMAPAADALSAGLASEIKSGRAEVLTAGNKLVVNISEDLLFMPGSYTFSQESPSLRSTLASLLKDGKLKGKEIYLGNSTTAVPAQSRGRKKIPGKEARTLAAERSAALIKDLVEKNGVNQDVLILAAYAPKQPEAGIKIKERKAMLIISNPLLIAARQETAASAHTQTVPSAQPKPIPIQPAQPKTK